MKVRDQLRECIDNGTPFKFRNVRIYKLTIVNEQINSLHWDFLIPSYINDNGDFLIEHGGALIATDYPKVFDVNELLKVLYNNRFYFTKPLIYRAQKIASAPDYIKKYWDMDSIRIKKYLSLL